MLLDIIWKIKQKKENELIIIHQFNLLILYYLLYFFEKMNDIIYIIIFKLIKFIKN